MERTIYTVNAAPMYPDGTQGFTRVIGRGMQLSHALRDAADWGYEWKAADAAETCPICDGDGCDECEGGKVTPDALDITVSWEVASPATLADYVAEQRQALIAKVSNIGYPAVADDLREGTPEREVLDRVIETMGEEEEAELLPLVQRLADLADLEPHCECGHWQAEHRMDTGACEAPGCQCRTFQPAAVQELDISRRD